jgi:hypothetical protein
MKKFAVTMLPVLLFACASQKDSTAALNGKPVIETPCPPEGKCTVTIHKDKSLHVKTDGINKLYYELADAPGKDVVIYAYNKTKNPDYQDDFYNEEVAFETDTQFSDLKAGIIPDMYFTVNCFCRGKAGTYKTEGGEVSINNDKLHIVLPQIVDNQLTKDVVVLFK